jgi:hypothetical protein
MERILNPISIEAYNPRGRKTRAQVFITVKFDESTGRLSITGVEGPLSNGNALGSCGQINMHLRESNRKDWRYNAGYDSATMDKLLEVWERWHLNDLKAGTPAQEAFIDVHKHEFDRLDWYGDACKMLQAVDLLVAEHEPEQMVWGVGRGYRYGTAWLSEEVPSEVIEFLFGLPATLKTPAWH